MSRKLEKTKVPKSASGAPKRFSRISAVMLLLLLGLLTVQVVFANSDADAPPDGDIIDVTPQVTVVATRIATIEPTIFASHPDLGDAPDSTNHFNVQMSAYPGVVAQFPTVYDSNTGLPSGPKHRNNNLRYVLGSAISAENEADQGIDADPTNNIIPPQDIANRDLQDDGLLTNQIKHCKVTQVQIKVTNFTAQNRQTYINLWADWNRSGVWGDFTTTCPNFLSVNEWAVSNLIYIAPPGMSTVTVPVVGYHTTASRLWARVTLSNIAATNADGRGPADPQMYNFGETEDYLLPSVLPPATVTAVPTVIGEATPIIIETPPPTKTIPPPALTFEPPLKAIGD